MALNVGARIGPYEVVSLLGVGGMGEVYRARDSKLNRDVAIKIVPASLASDPASLARFETEARAVAALSHPNILGIFDFGVGDGVPYAVMELLDGRPLREILADGPVSPRKAVDYGVQIAAGLAAAHGRGITHRDLKPENVFVTRDGQVKVLDFGLARVDVAASSGGGATVAATVNPTSPGTVLGTVGYMSPEQVRGQTADPRSDIFSLGVILYEALSGRRAFSGPSTVETMSAILKEDPPDLARTNPAVPPALDRIVQRALEKNPDERFQSARDFGFALEAISGSGLSAPVVPTVTDRQPWLRRALALVALLAAGGVGAFVVRSMGPAAPTQVTFETKTFSPQAIFNARFAPDGKTIVFSAALAGNSPELFVSRAGAVAPQPLGHKRTHLLSVSSTGELAVLTNASFIGHKLFRGTLARMSIDGAPRAWLENVREADWSPDGSTLAIVRDVGARDRLEYPIGTVLYEAGGYLSDVRVSPDGGQVAFFEHPARYDDRGFVKVVDTQGAVKTLAGEYYGMEGIGWARDGRTLIYSAAAAGADDYTPYAVQVGGSAAPQRVLPSAGAVFVFDVSSDGSWLVSRTDDYRSVRALLPGQTAEQEFAWLGAINLSWLSPDGNLLGFTSEAQAYGINYAVMIRKTDGSPPVRLGEGYNAALSPDGTNVLAGVFSPQETAIVYPLGPGDPIRLPRGPLEHVSAHQWFPDGNRVMVCGNEPARPARCYAQDLKGGVPKPLTPEGFGSSLGVWGGAQISPDGRTMFATAPDGVWVLVTIADGSRRPLAGITAEDTPANWTADQRALVVWSFDAAAASLRIDRLDPMTGVRTTLRKVSFTDPSGLLRVLNVRVINDGRSYAYGYWKRLSRLFAVRGMN